MGRVGESTDPEHLTPSSDVGLVREVAPGLVFADTLTRLAGYVVDVLVVGIIGSIVATILDLRPMTVSSELLAPGLAGFEYSVLSVAVGLVYFAGSWSGGRRATIGQRLFSMQVGNAFDGRPLTLEQAIRRWLGYGQFLALFSFEVTLAGVAGLIQVGWLVALLVTTASSPTKQGLHDRLAGTAIVRPTEAGRGLAVGCLAVIVIAGIVAILGLAAFLGTPEGRELLRELERR
jgi:uncharacterized RDD family membrane protein YckC